jgi:hypothetical protein
MEKFMEHSDLREKLAVLCHEQWIGWMKYLFSKCSHEQLADCEFMAAVIPVELIARWNRQIQTPYAELSEEEKESDRKEADKFLVLIDDFLKTEFKEFLNDKNS